MTLTDDWTARRAAWETVAVAGTPIVAVAPRARRLAIGLVMPVIERVVDTSPQPNAVCAATRQAARRAQIDAQEAEAALRAAITQRSQAVGGWLPDDPETSMVALLGGSAYPLLGATYDQGAAALEEIPRWAIPALSQHTPRDAAHAVFGARATTRPVVRAVAQTLVDQATMTVRLAHLALGLVAHELIQPDRLARVIAATSEHTIDLQPLSNEMIRTARRACAEWGELRTERILTDAATQPDGLQVLARTARYARDLDGHTPRRLPNRLTDLHDTYRSRIATDPGPRPVPTEPAPARPQTQAPAHAPLAIPVRPRPGTADRRNRVYAPPRSSAVSPLQVLDSPPAVRTMHGLSVGSLRLVIPRTAGDLVRWSRLLSNCLDDYGPAAATGRSTIIGVEHQNTLRYALELNPPTVIRQFVASANRPPDPDHRTAIVRELVRAEIVDPSEPANGIWIADQCPTDRNRRQGPPRLW